MSSLAEAPLHHKLYSHHKLLELDGALLTLIKNSKHFLSP